MKAGRKPKADSRFTGHAARLATVVREARDQAGTTQQELADKAHVSVSWVAKLERGEIIEPGLFPVLTILRELGVTGEFADLLESMEPR